MKDRMALAGFEWSGSHLRGWAFDGGGDILSSFHVREETLAGHPDWAGRLAFHLAEWLGEAPHVPVIGCGDLAAAPAGPPVRTPMPLALLATQLVEQSGIHLVPWIGQTSPPDLTCGAETVLLGLGDWNGAICLAGQHTRHCVVQNGRLLGFSTEITAELRDLLMTHGTLSRPPPGQQAFDMGVFRDWVERALDTQDTPPVFSVEAAMRQGLLSPVNKAAALAGLMIGADVAAHYDPGDEVLLVADGPLLAAYGFALDALGADVEEVSALEALQDGLFELADLAGLLGED